MDWCVDGVACVEGITETSRHHADDRVGATVNTDGLAHHIARAVEVFRPGFITEHDDVVLAGCLFAGKKRAPEHGRNAEDVEEVVGGADRLQNGRAIGSFGRGLAPAEITRQRLECGSLGALVLIRRPGCGLEIAAAAVVAVDLDDAIGMGIGQRAQNDCIEHAKNRRGQADAEGERQHNR
jgi:hypothetical protein